MLAKIINYDICTHNDFGYILLAISNNEVCLVLMDDDPAHLLILAQQRLPAPYLLVHDQAKLQLVCARILAYLDGKSSRLNIPISIIGSSFQKMVWYEISQIPVGETISYTNLAHNIRHPRAVRAVANACGANNLALIIPCHRVIGKNGDLAGYRWGIKRKQALLGLELAYRAI